MLICLLTPPEVFITCVYDGEKSMFAMFCTVNLSMSALAWAARHSTVDWLAWLNTYFSQFWRLRSLGSGCQHNQVLMRIFCLVHTANSLLYPHVVEKESWLSGFLLIRALIPRWELGLDDLTWTWLLQRPHLQTPPHSEAWLQHTNCDGI